MVEVTVSHGKKDPQKSEINRKPGDTFHSRIMSYEFVGCCEIISLKTNVLSKQWEASSWQVEGVADIIIFLKPEQLKSFLFPHYIFLSLSEMLSDWTLFLGKNLFQLEFGVIRQRQKTTRTRQVQKWEKKETVYSGLGFK